MQAEQTNTNVTNSDNANDDGETVKQHNHGNMIDEHGNPTDNKHTTKEKTSQEKVESHPVQLPVTLSSRLLAISNHSSLNTNEELCHLKENLNSSTKMKDFMRDERLKLVKQKREQEQLKRKEEIEENFRRKQELREKQLKERQRKINELRMADAERRAAVIERRRMHDQLTQARLVELLKRENERIEQINTIKKEKHSLIKSTNDCLTAPSPSGNLVQNMTCISDQHSGGPENTNNKKLTINKSQSAYNLATSSVNNKKREPNGDSQVAKRPQPSNIKPIKVQQTAKIMLSSYTSTSSASNPHSDLNARKEHKRSRTVPHTPISHNNGQQLTCNNRPYSPDCTSHANPQISTATFSTCMTSGLNMKNTNLSLPVTSKWEGPPAHFMLPTHAINGSCPRVAKVLAEASEIVSNQRQTHANTSDRAKASAAIQQNLNKNLSTKTNKSNNNNVNKPVSNSVKDECTEPSESVENPKKANSKNVRLNVTHAQSAKPSKPMSKDDSVINEHHFKRQTTQDKKASQMTRSMIVEKPTAHNSNRQRSSPRRDIVQSSTIQKSREKKLDLPKTCLAASNKSQPTTKSTKLSTSEATKFHEQDTQSVNSSCSALSGGDDVEQKECAADILTANVENQQIANEQIETIRQQTGKAINNDEEAYIKKMEEKRREAREKAAREAECERLRLEEQQRLEEELERMEAEEEMRLQQMAREQEDERLRLAIEEQERLETERLRREEAERKMKEDSERKAKEECERVERERAEKLKREEEERFERKKKVDEIMKRFQRDENAVTEQQTIRTNGTTLNSNPTVDLIENNNQTNESLKYKTPLLQSILSKTRLNNILNKYADDTTKSLLLNGNSNGDAIKLNCHVEETIDLDNMKATTTTSATTTKIAFELQSMNENDLDQNEGLNQQASTSAISPEISA